MVKPVVVLGDQKERIIGRWPFQESYERLWSDAEHADRVVVSGYSFRDEPLNRVLRSSLRPEAHVIVIDPVLEEDDVRKVLDPRQRLAALTVVKGELPAALESN